MIKVNQKNISNGMKNDVTPMAPLVTIMVGTYNSSKYVLETLESAKAQTYQNIELIISDDCSTDNTVQICRNWVEENKARFVRAELIEVEKNTGVSANCNRGLNAARGEWLKLIAGDDILLDTCIANFLAYCNLHKECKVLFGRTYLLIKDQIIPKPLAKIALANPKKQRELVYMGRPGPNLPAPASFFHKATLNKLGGFDTEYVLLEDLPLWAKFVNNNVRLHFLNEFVTKYRLHYDNISGNRSKHYINEKLYIDTKKYILKVLFPYYKEKRYFGMMAHFYNYFFISWLILYFGNKNTLLSKALSLLVFRTTLDSINNKLRIRSEQKFKI